LIRSVLVNKTRFKFVLQITVLFVSIAFLKLPFGL
jgi:hypothetical protein